MQESLKKKDHFFRHQQQRKPVIVTEWYCPPTFIQLLPLSNCFFPVNGHRDVFGVAK